MPHGTVIAGSRKPILKPLPPLLLDLEQQWEQMTPMRNPLPVLLGALLLSSLSPVRAADRLTVQVDAGDQDRVNAIVTFKVPPGAYRWAELKSGQDTFPLQVDKQGMATFILDKLAKGTRRTFEVIAKQNDKDAPPVAVRAKKDGSQYWFTADNHPVLFYQMEPSDVPSPDIPDHYRHGAHLHVFSPSGKLVTGDYPPDHYHHRGVFFGWTHTEFEGRQPDFWNMGKDKSGKLTGEVRFEKLEDKWSGTVNGGFVGKHQWLDHTSGEARPALNETWKVTIYNAAAGAGQGAINIFDLESTQTCATDAPLKLPKYYYGGLGYRGSRQWDDPKNFFVLTSGGETDRVKANQNPCRWIALSGKVDGALCGFAILDHPSNFRAPQTVRVNPKNPQTCHSVSETGDWEIVPGKPYVSKYRMVAFDGEPDKAVLERLWQDYAHPAKVTVK